MTGLCLVFALIYEFLGHGVYSWRIRALFVVPLIMAGLFIVLKRTNPEPFLPALTLLRLLAASEIARNAFIGIVEVYGTRTSKDLVLGVVSAFLAAGTVIAAVICGSKVRKKKT